ncbi:MAG: NADPH:quinone oxidoreductase family protein [Myxococcota bacterium]|nr:NADPH:quinone oxidoreductase family protein [Myxococcota bacterium]
MRAISVDGWTEPKDLRVSEVPEPALRPGTLAVHVRAAGCNFADTLMVQGRYQVKPAFPFVPGLEFAGTVSALGEGVEGFAPGDRVFGAPGLGCFAEVAVVPAALTFALPDGMSFEEGAGVPITYPTSYAALVTRAALQPGETLLVHAAAGGVGLAAVQIGVALGARVIATAGGAEKCEIARENGAEHVIDYRSEDFVERVLDLTEGRGADVIYDSVGGDTLDRSLKCIAWNGRLLVIGFASGTIPSVKANRILLKNISLVGLHWSAYPEREPEAIAPVFEGLLRLHATGRIRPLVSASHPLEELPAALEALASRRTTGKVVVIP